MPMELRMPRGTALAALLASSDICTQESKAPMVHIGESQASIKAQPVGHVVRFSTSAKIKCPSLRWLALPTGSAMIVARIRARFYTIISHSFEGVSDPLKNGRWSDHEYGKGLDLVHDFGQGSGQDTMRKRAYHEHHIDNSIAGCPCSVCCDDNNGAEHERESIWSGVRLGNMACTLSCNRLEKKTYNLWNRGLRSSRDCYYSQPRSTGNSSSLVS